MISMAVVKFKLKATAIFLIEMHKFDFRFDTFLEKNGFKRAGL